MNSHEDPAYRLKLAQRYLEKAETAWANRHFDDCLTDAQQAVENAGKAILGHFRPIPRTHDVVGHLESLAEQRNVPDPIRQKIRADLGAFLDMGLETHVRAAYGDEATRTPPWELIQEPEAQAGLEKARRAVAMAEAIYAKVIGRPPD